MGIAQFQQQLLAIQRKLFPESPLFELNSSVEAYEISNESEFINFEKRLAKLLLDAGENPVGIDTESISQRGVRPKLALVQVSFGPVVLLARVHQVSQLPPALVRLLEDSTILKVFHDTKNDLPALLELAPEMQPQNCVSVVTLAKLYGFNRLSLKDLTEDILTRRIDKTLARSNWGRTTLSDGQIQYAAADAEIPRLLHQKLQSGVYDSGAART